ncbi:hypothetical protein Hanom_Chr05g00463241 [Helianthus anomalus]
MEHIIRCIFLLLTFAKQDSASPEPFRHEKRSKKVDDASGLERGFSMLDAAFFNDIKVHCLNGLGYIENPKYLRNPGNSKLPTFFFFFLKKITHVIYMFLRVLGQKNQKSAEGFFFFF